MLLYVFCTRHVLYDVVPPANSFVGIILSIYYLASLEANTSLPEGAVLSEGTEINK